MIPTPAQVRVLCRRLRSDQKRIPNMEQNVMLCVAVQNGIEADLALETMLHCHNGLVLRMANKLTRGLNHEDAMQAGRLGLVKAVRMFDAARGLNFSTYATHWIASTMRRVTVQGNFQAHIPEHSLYRWLKIRRFIAAFVETNERMPEAEEISEGLGIEISEIEDSSGIQRMELLSIDGLSPTGFDSDFSRMLPSSPSPENQVVQDSEFDRLHEAINRLSGAQKIAIIEYFGLDGEPKSMREIGEQLGISPNAVHCRLTFAFKTLRKFMA